MKKASKLVLFVLLVLVLFHRPVIAQILEPNQIFLPMVVKPENTPTPTLTPITPTPMGPTATPIPQIATTGNIQIISIRANGSGTSEPDEYVEIKNMDSKIIQVHNWTIRDIANHVYTFRSYEMQPGQTCRVYTNQDHPEYCSFNYQSSSAIWNNSGDTAYLKDSTGKLIDEYSYN
ncbi:MAG: hypothetical protein CL609_22840 [Anaerolineaceae bacterium]|nr:hypothetical protein [Anaerolineaceae bacterium]